jgi:outer membrane biosynthesis protein TonB
VRTRQFGELDHSELVRLLDTLDDERSRARFRESIYISIFVWVGIGCLLFFAPRIFPHAPRFVTPATETKEHQITSLELPPDIQKEINHAPRFKAAPKPPAPSNTPQLQQPAAPPAAAPPEPAPRQTAPQPQPAQQQPPVVQQSPLQQPRPVQQQNLANLPSAPAPAPTANRPSFANPNTSARDMVQQAAQAPRGGSGLDEGPSGGGLRSHGLGAGVEMLTDTQGVDFDQYLKKIIAEIRTTWLPLIPEEARPPLNKQGETQIRFIILPDGRIGGMTLEGSTHDDAINKSCWGSITGVGQFPPLPSQFHGPNIELRVHYLVNKEPR